VNLAPTKSATTTRAYVDQFARSLSLSFSRPNFVSRFVLFFLLFLSFFLYIFSRVR